MVFVYEYCTLLLICNDAKSSHHLIITETDSEAGDAHLQGRF